MQRGTDSPARTGRAAPPLLRRLQGEVGDRPVVWLMRQAGRYLPEYREIRAQARDFLALCYDPALATEITLQPVRRFNMDAAILFSDILVVPHALGVEVTFAEGEGPKLPPFRNERDLARLRPGRLLEAVSPVLATLRRLRQELPADVALLGFAGAPWTLAAYMVEGGGSRDYAAARSFARRQRSLFEALIELLTAATVDYLAAQIEAGAQAVQLFDSWAGVLPETELKRWSLEPTRRIVAQLARRHPGVPVLLFPRGVGPALLSYAGLGASGLSLDTTIPPAWAARQLPRQLCLQGNLDPVALLGPPAAMIDEAEAILRSVSGRPHIFNLGHGVLPQTSPDMVAELIGFLKSVTL